MNSSIYPYVPYGNLDTHIRIISLYFILCLYSFVCNIGNNFHQNHLPLYMFIMFTVLIVNFKNYFMWLKLIEFNKLTQIKVMFKYLKILLWR